MSKKIYMLTFGCQMNDYDSELVKGVLQKAGYVFVQDMKLADIILLNTCSVRKTAVLHVHGKLSYELKPLKEANPNLIIGVLGCIAEDAKEEMFKFAPYVDLVIGPRRIGKLKESIEKILQERNKILFTGESEAEEKIYFDSLHFDIQRSNNIKANVTIIRGCSNYCSYCIVPYLRGKEISRQPEDIIGEVKRLADEGFKEITLIGQNVDSYGKDLNANMNFAKLLEMVSKIKEILRIRFATSHPRDMSGDVINVIKQFPQICEHFHIPVQAGADKILKLMNRGYTNSEYRCLVDKIRKIIPDASITTDIIVGFPGEEDIDFNETLKLIKDIEVDFAFTFKYSIRKGTKAADMTNQIDEKIKAERLKILSDVQADISKRKNEKLIGNTIDILIDGYDKKAQNKLIGRTKTNKLVILNGEGNLIGKIVDVKIVKANAWTLYGDLI
ncbi:MAG: tRNA (N6-isopentenyl adenosine(37)-C2)-methylthiotransferase MiaB [Candidatus Firestonebacteria bacterium]